MIHNRLFALQSNVALGIGLKILFSAMAGGLRKKIGKESPARRERPNDNQKTYIPLLNHRNIN